METKEANTSSIIILGWMTYPRVKISCPGENYGHRKTMKIETLTY